MKRIFVTLLFAIPLAVSLRILHAADSEKIQLTITGGHETDPRDHGRPVVLIGNALGVTPEIFREAFSYVRPAPAGREPEPEQVRRNKTALLSALSKYGVSNETLDRVSNYYRYQPGGNRLWPTKPATAFATVKNGVVDSITISDAGSGYSSPPKISVPGHQEIALKSTLSFSRDLKSNGSVKAISFEKAIP
jgi:hypothetical protein